ncbi:hypothetical protein N9971_00470 [bacterium]|nr:hypothetical protein [bacterium]
MRNVAIQSVVVIGAVVFAGVALADTRVAVPTGITWAELEPYVEANIRVDDNADGLTVSVSSAILERELIKPYDPLLGELATVLLMEVMSDRKAGPIMIELAEALSSELPTLQPVDRDGLIAMYWERLELDGRVLARAERIYQRMQRKGRAPCAICDEGFNPLYLRIL